VRLTLAPASRGMAWAVMVFGLISTFTISRLDAQDSTISATLLRVLAEAADVHRTGRPIFLVAAYRYPHRVAGAVPSRALAEKLRADSGAAFGIFGPYVTPGDSETASNRVLTVRLTLQTPEGRQTVDVNPDSADAVFLSLSAVDKFVIPYYTRTYGPGFAGRLRSLIARRGMIMHCWSDMCFPDPRGLLRPLRVGNEPRLDR
jgi:hypothetical protein